MVSGSSRWAHTPVAPAQNPMEQRTPMTVLSPIVVFVGLIVCGDSRWLARHRFSLHGDAVVQTVSKEAIVIATVAGMVMVLVWQVHVMVMVLALVVLLQ